MEEENNNNFEVISSKTSNANFKQNKQSKQNSFGKTVLIPFASGIVGCSLVLGTCFGIPSIKEKLVGKQSSTVQTSTQTAYGIAYCEKLLLFTIGTAVDVLLWKFSTFPSSIIA